MAEVSDLMVMVSILELVVSVLSSSVDLAIVILVLVFADFRASIASYHSSIIELSLFVAEHSELDIEF